MESTATNTENPPKVDPIYYEEGARWEQDIYRKMRRSRAIAWMVTFLFGGIAIASLTALLMLIPLKEFEPYVVLVDRTTGYKEVTRALKEDMSVTERESVITADIVRYVRARETYDPDAVQENFELAMLLSTGEAARELNRLYSVTNPDNPVRRYGRNTDVSVEIKSISMPNRNTALVRFQTTEDDGAQLTTRHWVSLVRFRTTSTPQRNDWLWENPLGFQVTEYRRDQESVTPDVRVIDQ